MTLTRSEIQHAHNIERHHHGLRPFVQDSGLNASAQIVAHRLARRDQGIEHARFWWKVIDRQTRFRYGAKGENLAEGFTAIGALIQAWMQSVLHRRNILNRSFTRIGIGVAVAQSGRMYYVVHFGGQ